jgi:hypothetical protein
MPLGDPNIHPSEALFRPVIRQLDDAAINRIAAGEVVERPQVRSRNWWRTRSMPGRADQVEVADGGKTLIRVTDDGCGMGPDDLPLALSRHATSKIDGSDLLNITSFGFRGEALPSLGAVGRLTITSRATAPRPTDRGVGRRDGPGETRRAEPRHGGRAARPVPRHARAAEVPALRPGRGAGDHRRGQAPRHGRTGRRLHPARRRGATA